MSGLRAAGAAARASVTRRRAWIAALTVALLALGVALASVVPGPTARWAPFTGSGEGSATSGPLTVEVHGATLAEAIVVDGEVVETTGVFVVLDVTFAATEPLGLLSHDLVIDGVRYDASPKGPPTWRDSEPETGLPVRGDLVFEVDAALVEGGATLELQVAPGLDANGDLRSQVAVRVAVDGSVVAEAEPQELSR